MKKKIIWLVVSFLMVLSLVMASCGPAEEEEVVEEEIETVKLTFTKLDGTKVEKTVERPQYGGTLTRLEGDPPLFDPGLGNSTSMTTLYYTNEELMRGDWYRGPSGTNETDWIYGFLGRAELETGSLAESWEIVGEDTVIFHIRKGIHWHNIPPVNGREYTAEDAAWNINREFTSEKAYLHTSYAVQGYEPVSIEVLDKYTLEVKFTPPTMLGMLLLYTGDYMKHMPREMVELHGDMNDWENACGTGPFMLTDYIPATSFTLVRNPDYWMHDPAFPENQLPYIDEIKGLVITDSSTQTAAFRTGELDYKEGITWEDAELLSKSNPELHSIRYVDPGGTAAPVGRVDKPELPFHDILVRRALNLAINKQALIDDYYEGNAILLGFPYPDTPAFSPFYTPLEELPEECQELFTYNPEKARQLLAEAGYPEGFQTKIQCNATGTGPDFLAIIREYFLDINVDMKIEPLDSSVWRSVSRNMEEMGLAPLNIMFPHRMLCFTDSMLNYSHWEDPSTRNLYESVCRVVGVDNTETARLLKQAGPIQICSALYAWVPFPYKHNMWWPWVKGYNGEGTMGNDNKVDDTTYMWIDETLKKSMGY